jgi:transmembrane sensor
MNKERVTHLVQKLRKGDATIEEQSELEQYWQWAQSDRTLFDAIPNEERELIQAVMFRNIQHRITGKRRVIALNSLPVRIAAAVVIAMISFLLWPKPDADQLQFQTAFGEQKNILLPDGSKIQLNGNSSIHYSSEWNTTNDREIWISGEAFFEVTHTANHQPFIVHTGESLDVKVLGTRFNVKVRRHKTEVMLEEGKVRLQMNAVPGRDTLTMKPGDLVTLMKEDLKQETVIASRYAAWKDHKLYFSETPLSEVAKILEDTYGFEVQFKKRSLNDRKLSGEIQSKDGEEILTAIRESLDIKITEDGRKVVFY